MPRGVCSEVQVARSSLWRHQTALTAERGEPRCYVLILSMGHAKPLNCAHTYTAHPKNVSVQVFRREKLPLAVPTALTQVTLPEKTQARVLLNGFARNTRNPSAQIHTRVLK